MRSLWKGAVAFGLVTFPVKLYKATEERTIRFHQLHASCEARIRNRKVCEACGEEVPLGGIVRGYEYERGSHVTLTDAELDRGLPQARVIEIRRFISPSDVDPSHRHAAYYLGPDQVGVKPYRLLQAAMRAQSVAALACVALRDKQHPALLRLHEDVLVLDTLWWPDEIRAPALDYLDTPVELGEQETAMAAELVRNLTGSFDLTEFRDTYRERIESLIAAKLEGDAPSAPIEPSANVVDLMEALKASVEASAQRDAASHDEPNSKRARASGR